MSMAEVEESTRETESSGTSRNKRESTAPAKAAATAADVAASEIADLKMELKTVSEALSKAYHRQAELQDDSRMLRVELDKERRAKMQIEDDFAKLQVETQDLSENLFGEADKMVIAARRETQSMERKNAQLRAQLEETSLLLENVQAESSELKKFIQNMNDQERDRERMTLAEELAEREIGAIEAHNGEYSNDEAAAESFEQPVGLVTGRIEDQEPNADEESSTYWSLSDESQLCSFIRPLIRSNTPYFDEFLGFLNHIALVHKMAASSSTYHNDSNPSSLSLKEFKVFKHCLNDEIEPTLRLDLAPGLSWLGRRSVMNAILDGTVTIEPIVGVNEMVGSFRPRSVNQARPVATKSPCAFCGEARYDDILHLRLHNLQIGAKRKSLSRSVSRSAEPLSRTQSHEQDEEVSRTASASSNASTGAGPFSAPVPLSNSNGHDTDPIDHVNNSLTPVSSDVQSGTSTPTASVQAVSTGYPLCHFCLNRVRTVCDLVQFMRSLRDRVFRTDGAEAKLRAWTEFARLKERMFWARTGGVFAPLNWDKQRARTGRTRPNSTVPLAREGPDRRSTFDKNAEGTPEVLSRVPTESEHENENDHKDEYERKDEHEHEREHEESEPDHSPSHEGDSWADAQDEASAPSPENEQHANDEEPNV